MREKAALAIAALMLVSLAMGITIEPAVAQGVSVSVEPSYIPAGPTTLKVTVTNNTGQLADRVVIQVLKDGTLQNWDLAGLAIIPKGENVIVTTAVDNNVFIAVNNVFILDENIEGIENFLIPATTELLVGRVPGYQIYVEKLLSAVTLGTDNLRVRPRSDVGVDENLIIGDNLAAPVPLQVSLAENNKVGALDNIRAYWVNPSENKLAPIENALLKNLALKNAVLIVSAENRVKVIKAYDNLHLRDNKLVAMESKWSGTPYAINPGDNLQLITGAGAENRVYLPPGSILMVAENVNIKLPENLVLIRPAENCIIAENYYRVVTLPAGWSAVSVGHTLTFQGVGDNIPVGQTRIFEFVAKPSGSGKYTVRVTLFYGSTQLAMGTADIEVDTTPPSVKSITATPQWAKANTEVVLGFEFSETVIVENITLREYNGNEVTLSLTPVEGSDNKKWTATYTTGDNKQRDGPATITIVKVKDRVGNTLTGQTWDNVLFVDRVAPSKPNLSAFINWFSGPIQAQNTQFVRLKSDNIKDNYPSTTENENTVEKVIIRVDNSTYEMFKDIYGNWQYTITFLPDGKHEVGVFVIDKAGNVGEEYAENVWIDNNKPTITFVFPENGQYIKDNTPTIRVIIADTVGVENSRVIDGIYDNDGYRVDLCYENGAVWVENLVPSAYPTQTDNVAGRPVFTTFTFENTLSIELPDNTYILRVTAGDNLRLESVWIKFTVDTKAPNPPPKESLVGNITAGELDNPTGTKTRIFTLRGTAEPGATIKVYITTDGGVTWTEVTASRTTAGADGSWLTQIDLSAYAGRNIGIAVTATDRAGNESDRKLYGYLIYDASAPRVTITSPQTGTKTSKTSIQVTGTVTKDSWEEWSDITLTIQVGTGSVTLPVFGTGDTANFSYSVALAEGTNTIMVIVSDGMNSSYDSVTVTRTVTPWGTYAVVLVIIALILAAIAILRVKK